MTASHAKHGPEEMCPAGMQVYQRALQEGHVTQSATGMPPCLVDFGFLHPALDNPDRLEPASPMAALHRLLHASGRRIADERRREEQLVEAFAPLIRAESSEAADVTTLLVVTGKEQISRAVADALADATEQALTIQPYQGPNSPPRQDNLRSLQRDQAFLDRGGRIRTLYQHTYRHAPHVLARYEQLTGDVEARTLDEVTERLIIVDRTVAFIPASADRSLALEVRHPALIAYFANTFDRLWRLATPMHPQAVHRPTLNGVTPRQRAIAALLVEGHTDTDIAERLGMNVRTARVHIAKLAATLGSESRAQLGYLIGRSGILDQGG
ncbi:helix-turn-helix transcriptional regulator [Streptomyces tendae]|uniref:Helix-turn-helix transcriptional regulator n=1 Tax=Streptomyces tendae TaxID=1932 RepID=A0A6B3QRD2_STRTE|nr:LuxR C-terminal-related transcriptional regulator [Streptomyces tendae]NEV88935.1 helix-turn-helix transcriptional regulator [Streptomyces tendae]BET48751.1 LuxR C-terminal-related transcriptional regulator [Kitasatospora aureofaciens]